METINMKYLKPKQKKLIKYLQTNRTRYISLISDTRDLSQRVQVEDDGLNVYFEVPLYRFDSLIHRNILKSFDYYGSLTVTVEKFKLNNPHPNDKPNQNRNENSGRNKGRDIGKTSEPNYFNG